MGGWGGGGMVTYLGLAYILPIQVGWVSGVGGWVGWGGMVTYLGLAYILPIQVGWVGGVGGVGGGGMITYLGLAYILPYRFDLDRLDGLGGWGGGDDNVPWTCTHTTIRI